MPDPLRISLWGMPGAGKSTLGKILAHRLNMPFYDLDALVEQTSKLHPSSWILHHGEEAFRRVEENTLSFFFQSTKGNFILATGGGTILRESNRNLLLSNTKCIFIDCDIDILARRLQTDTTPRPLLSMSQLYDVYSKRLPLYQLAPWSISNNLSLSSEFISRLCSMVKEIMDEKE